MPSLPKDSDVLNVDVNGEVTQYTLVSSGISTENHTATLTFTVNRDEPYQEDNKIWINWGVFDNPSDFDQSKVMGSRDPKTYDILLTYSDYFDRVFINGIYWITGFAGMLSFWASLPISFVPLTILFLYVMFHPIWIWFTAPVSENFSFDNYFEEVVLRWQIGNIVYILALLVADGISYAPLGSLYYQYYAYNGVSSDDWELFAGYSVVAWVFQFVIALIAFAIAASAISE